MTKLAGDFDLAKLEAAMERIRQIAADFGLDPFPTHFEIVPATIMYEFGAYGLPGRFSHWTHGRAYHQTKTMYDYGLSKIYELVINANPAYAFLMENNSLVQNKLVVAHVLAHTDFFKHNAYFARTNRQMIEGVEVNAERIRKYEFRQGQLVVEQFLDSVLAIEEHVDPHITLRRQTPPRRWSDDDDRAKTLAPAAPRATPYDDLLRLGEDHSNDLAPAPKRFPEEPDKDLLYFLAEHSPDLEAWQRDIIHIVRSEMLYFVPQMQTKIMNEGWASYWHSRIMRELDLTEAEYVEYAQLNASVVAPTKRSLNPYYVGLKIFEDIERRWDNPTAEERERFGRAGGEGRARIFEVRELENDASFIRNYLTKQLVDDLDLYIYKQEGDELRVVEKDHTKIRDMIVATMNNFGNPYIVVYDGDYHRARELYLKHVFEGQEIDFDYAEKTLRHVHSLWRRTVHLETVLNDKATLLSFDGERNSKRPL